MLAARRRPAPSSQTLQSRPVHPIKTPPSKERHWGQLAAGLRLQQRPITDGATRAVETAQEQANSGLLNKTRSDFSWEAKGRFGERRDPLHLPGAEKKNPLHISGGGLGWVGIQRSTRVFASSITDEESIRAFARTR